MKNSVVIKSFGLLTPSVRDIAGMAPYCRSVNGTFPLRAEAIVQPDGMPLRDIRRMARLTRFALYAADAACREAGVSGNPQCGLIVGLTHGTTELLKDFHDYWFDFGPNNVSPAAFSNGVTNAPLGAVSKHCRLTAGGVTLNGAEECGMVAMNLAAQAILRGDYDFCCTGASEEYSGLVADVYRRRGWFCGEIPVSLPCLIHSQGFAQSEGSCFCVLGRYSGKDERVCLFTPLSSIDALDHTVDVVISGAGGGPQDRYELDALERIFSRSKKPPQVLFSKCFFGETFSTGAFLSIAMAWDILMNGARYPAYPLDPSIIRASLRDDCGSRDVTSVLVVSASRGGAVTAGLLTRR
jgi:3-oxoacyl-(acyl-carrier-protein) synthase